MNTELNDLKIIVCENLKFSVKDFQFVMLPCSDTNAVIDLLPQQHTDIIVMSLRCHSAMALSRTVGNSSCYSNRSMTSSILEHGMPCSAKF